MLEALGDPRAFLRALFDEAVAVADPMRVIARRLPAAAPAKTLVVGAGKASARMAEAVEAAWGPQEGLVVTRYGYGRPTRGVEIVEAAHPTPDAAGRAATRRLLTRLAALDESWFVLALISGGASSLLVDPAGAVTLEEKAALNAALLASGMPIQRMNVVRKHLSRVKGGQLAAAAHPAEMRALLISDVPGDDPGAIGSGPTVGEASAAADAQRLLDDWSVPRAAAVDAALAAGSSVVAPGDPRLARARSEIIAAPSQSLAAARDLAAAAGVEAEILGDAIEGEAREIGARHAALAQRRRQERRAGDPPLLLLSGGELTVTRRGDGVGGPNAEYALALAVALGGEPDVYAIACDTDGVDGAAEVAGAHIDPETLPRAGGADAARRALAANDSHAFFAALGDQVVTGPTLTNVNDFRAVLIAPSAG